MTTLAYGVNFSGFYVGKFTKIKDADKLDAPRRSIGAMTDAGLFLSMGFPEICPDPALPPVKLKKL